jgi:hypothetical protein
MRPFRIWLALVSVAGLIALPGCGDEPAESQADNAAAPAETTEPDTTDDGGDGWGTEEDTLVEVPDVVGKDGQDAVDTLEYEGFSVDFSDYRDDAAGCEVLSQDPEVEAEPESEVMLELVCRQVDWDNQEGEDWELFDEAYLSGWNDGCDEAFSNSPDGNYLYDADGEERSASDCQDNRPYDATNADYPQEVPDDPEGEGSDLGEDDGCVSAFDDLSWDGVLRYEDQEFDSSWCP